MIRSRVVLEGETEEVKIDLTIASFYDVKDGIYCKFIGVVQADFNLNDFTDDQVQYRLPEVGERLLYRKVGYTYLTPMVKEIIKRS